MIRTAMAKFISFIITIAIAIYIIPDKYQAATTVVLTVVAAFLFIFFLIKKKAKTLMFISLFSLLAMIILVLYNNLFVYPIKELSGKTVGITATVTNTEKSSNGNTFYIVRLNSVSGKSIIPGAKVSLYSVADILHDYDEISAEVTFFESDNLSSYDKYYLSNSISGSCFASSEITVTNKKNFSLLREICRIRDESVHNIRSRVVGEEGEIICGILFGKRDLISKETGLLFSNAGISHLLAVSGLHLSILISIINAVLLRIFLLSKKIRGIFAFLFVLLLSIMVGFTPSVTRSVMMTFLVLIAQNTRRDYDAPTAISFSAFTICLINPYSILNIGFMLSFSATIGLAISNNIINNIRVKFSLKTVKVFPLIMFNLFKLSLPCFFAYLFTVPVTAYAFGSFSIYSPLINLMISPFISILLGLSLFGAVFSFIPIPFISEILLNIAAIIVSIVMQIAKQFNSLPLSKIDFESDLMPFLVIILVIFFLISLYSDTRKKNYIISIALFIPILCISVIFQNIVYKDTSKILTIGSSLLIETDGKVMISGYTEDASIELSRHSDGDIFLLTAQTAGENDITSLSTYVRNIPVDYLAIPKEYYSAITTINLKDTHSYITDNFSISNASLNAKCESFGKNSVVHFQINGFRISHLLIYSIEELPPNFECDLLVTNSSSIHHIDNYKCKYLMLCGENADTEFLSKALKAKGITLISNDIYLKQNKLYKKADLF